MFLLYQLNIYQKNTSKPKTVRLNASLDEQRKTSISYQQKTVQHLETSQVLESVVELGSDGCFRKIRHDIHIAGLHDIMVI